MTHDEVIDKLRTKYQGRIWWRYEMGDHNDPYTPKNFLSCWAVSNAAQGQNLTLYLLEMSDRHGKEQGFELLVALDPTNDIGAAWVELDARLGIEPEAK